MNYSPDQKLLRAERLKKLRKMTHLSRKAFSNKHSISQGTLQNWETARFGGLTEKGAHIMIESLRMENLYCSFEWLMYGVGNSPIIDSEAIKLPIAKPSTHNQTDIIKEELKLFTSQKQQTKHFYVTDDAMTPLYMPGTTLAGKTRLGKDICSVVNKVCIVETSNHTTLLRYIRKGTEHNRFDLISLNNKTRVEQAFILNTELVSATPISWVRTEDNL